MSAPVPPSLPLPPAPADAPPLRWGILGPGGIARKFATEVPARSAQEIVAVGSRSADKARAFADEHGIASAYGSYAELVADPRVEAVYVATPHSLHRDHALLALEAGRHVLVEKPFTRSAAEAREVFDVAAARGLFAMEALWTRFLPHLVAVRAVIASGALGEILSVQADHGQRLDTVDRLLDPELAGGALLDLGVYPLSFAHMVLGAPAGVAATGVLSERGVDVHEAVTLTYAGAHERAIAVCTANMWAASATTASVVGTEGRIDVDGPFWGPVGFTVTPFGGEPWRWPGADEPVAQALTDAGFEHEATEVARCVAAGRQESEVLPWQATVEVMETMDEVRRLLGVVYPGE